MNEKNVHEIKKESLIAALNNKFDKEIFDVEYTVDRLCKGTVAEVIKIEGSANNHEYTLPFKLVLKIQKK